MLGPQVAQAVELANVRQFVAVDSWQLLAETKT
jgi:hypothetical protein